MFRRIRNLWRLSGQPTDYIKWNQAKTLSTEPSYEEVKQAVIIRKKDDVINKIVNGK